MRNPLKDAIQGRDLVATTHAQIAVVTSVTPLEVNLSDTTGLPASWIGARPSLNDVVLVLAVDPDIIVIGTINTDGP